MSEQLAQLEKKGGGGGITRYARYTLGMNDYHNSSVTVPKDGWLSACMNLTYSSSGYVRLKVNGAYVINTTSRGNYWYDSEIKKGDVIAWEQNSGSTSWILICTE